MSAIAQLRQIWSAVGLLLTMVEADPSSAEYQQALQQLVTTGRPVMVEALHSLAALLEGQSDEMLQAAINAVVQRLKAG